MVIKHLSLLDNQYNIYDCHVYDAYTPMNYHYASWARKI